MTRALEAIQFIEDYSHMSLAEQSAVEHKHHEAVKTIRAALKPADAGALDADKLLRPISGILYPFIQNYQRSNDAAHAVIDEIKASAISAPADEKKPTCQADDFVYLADHHHITETSIGLARVFIKDGEYSRAKDKLDHACVLIDELIERRNKVYKENREALKSAKGTG